MISLKDEGDEDEAATGGPGWRRSPGKAMSDVVTNHFYVDEAGDLTLLGRHGKSLVGTEGVSKCFMVGMAHIADPKGFRDRLNRLRSDLLGDPYLKSVPSMQPKEGKTASFFHAKDDCQEVRREVFRLLADWDIKVKVGISRKSELVKVARLAESVRKHQQRQGRSPISPWRGNTVYDDMVKTLFKNSLHKADANVICFARRGKSARQEALAAAIQRAKENFERDTGIPSDRPTKIIPSFPSESCGLQAVDYFLWALQRLYERGEDRYFNYLASHYRLIMDFDDKRDGKTKYGRWYSDRDPLTKEKIMPVTG